MLGHWHQERWVIPTLLVRVVGGLITTILLAGLLGGCSDSSTQAESPQAQDKSSTGSGISSEKAAVEESSTGSGISSEKAAVEEMIRGYYQAVAAEDYEKTYTYFGPGFRKSYKSRQDYLDTMNDIPKGERVEDLTIESLDSDISDAAENRAVASVDVSFFRANTSTKFHHVEEYGLVKEDGQWKLNELNSLDDLTLLTLIPLGMKLSDRDAEPGWQEVTIPFGVRNDNFDPLPVEFPGPPRVSIEEGRTYDFELPYLVEESFSGFQLPSEFALCGIVASDESNEGTTDVERLQAIGQTPLGTTPTALMIERYGTADLTGELGHAECAPRQLADLPEDNITLYASKTASASASQSGSASASQSASASAGITVEADLHIEGIGTVTKNQGGSQYARTVLTFTLTNQSKLDDFGVGDLRVWLLDEDGVVRSPYADPYVDVPVDAFCSYDSGGTEHLNNPMTLTVGPSQEEPIRVCFPYRPGHHAAAVLFESSDPDMHEVVVPTIVEETS